MMKFQANVVHIGTAETGEFEAGMLFTTPMELNYDEIQVMAEAGLVPVSTMDGVKVKTEKGSNIPFSYVILHGVLTNVVLGTGIFVYLLDCILNSGDTAKINNLYLYTGASEGGTADDISNTVLVKNRWDVLGASGMAISADMYTVHVIEGRPILCMEAKGFELDETGTTFMYYGDEGVTISGAKDLEEDFVYTLKPKDNVAYTLNVQPGLRIVGRIDLALFALDTKSPRSRVDAAAKDLSVFDKTLSQVQQTDLIYEEINKIAELNATGVVEFLITPAVAPHLGTDLLGVKTLPRNFAIGVMARRIGLISAPGTPLFDESTLKDASEWYLGQMN